MTVMVMTGFRVSGNDTLNSGEGTNRLIGGVGDDVFRINPGDHSETTDFGTGQDVLEFRMGLFVINLMVSGMINV